jgi:hypothetical protein
LRQRIIAREPPGWSSLDYLLDATPRLQDALGELGAVHLVISSEQTTLPQIIDQIRSARSDKMS